MENTKYIVADKEAVKPNMDGFVDPFAAISAAKKRANESGKPQVILCFVREVNPVAVIQNKEE